jgi:hypothetical protein
MDDAPDARDGPAVLIAGLRVERANRRDGRYVNFFSWPEEGPPPSETAGADAAPAAGSQPWNVSSGPPEERAPRV